VLQIGGLKEKILAAHRGGINRVMIPKDNEKDIEEIPASVREGVEIIPVAHVDEVLREALMIADHESYTSLLEARNARYKDLFGDKMMKVEGDLGEDAQPQDLVAH